jgi:aryl-alcohol dehydrogenase-like predicted oxidoreductase
MAYRRLSGTGLELSALCLGCWNFGTEEPWMIGDESAALSVIDAAVDAGVNVLDTANVYSHGESERIVGRALESFDRDELVVTSKVFGRMRDGPNGQGLSRKHVLEQVERSLDRLGTDYLDLYQIHRWDETTPITETLAALDYLVEEGLVRYVGASSMAAWKFTKALYEADLHNRERFASMQLEYSLVARHEEQNLLPVCADQNVGTLVWSPLAGGFLADEYDRESSPDPGTRAAEDPYMNQRFTEENWAVLDVVRDLADRKDATPAQVSLAWLLHKDAVDGIVIGPNSRDHLTDSLAALEVTLSDAEIDRLEAPKSPRWSDRKVPW